jgi:hypothetical protein
VTTSDIPESDADTLVLVASVKGRLELLEDQLARTAETLERLNPPPGKTADRSEA